MNYEGFKSVETVQRQCSVPALTLEVLAAEYPAMIR